MIGRMSASHQNMKHDSNSATIFFFCVLSRDYHFSLMSLETGQLQNVVIKCLQPTHLSACTAVVVDGQLVALPAEDE